MKGGAKAQLFTLDLLLALIPLTVALGMSANAMSGVVTQITDYTDIYGTKRVNIDAADVLIKTSGDPKEWDNSSIQVLGFAAYVDTCESSNVTLSHVLDTVKLSTFEDNLGSSAIRSSVYNLSGGSNIRIVITNTSGTVLDVMGYTDGTGTWQVTNDTTVINGTIANAADVFVVERVVSILDLRSLGWSLITSLSVGGDTEDSDLKLKSTPAVGDLDGDGNREIVMAPEDIVYAVYRNGTTMWTYSPTGDEFKMSSPALTDLNGDGKLETIVGSRGGIVYAIYHNGSLYWNYTAGGEIWSSPAVADIDGDSSLEIVVGEKDTGNVTVLNSDGSVLWTSCCYPTKSSPAVANLDGDVGLEIVFGTEDSTIVALDHNGSELWNYTTGGHVHSSPAIYDINNDGILEVVVGANDNNLYVLNETGGLVWNENLGGKISSSPALADLNGDGKLEIIFGSEDDKVYAYYSNGSKLWEYLTGDKIKWSSPAVGDIDGDCKLEVVIGSKDDYLYAINHDGSLLWRYETGDKIETSPVIVDLDGDSYLDVIIGSDDEVVYVINTAGSGPEWPIFHQCLKRAGYYYDSDCSGPFSTTTTRDLTGNAVKAHLKVYLWD